MSRRCTSLAALLLLVVATASAAEDQYFDSDGVKIHYVVEGEGEPVILVHGFTGNVERDWQKTGTLSQLSKDYHVIALDNRGHGRSEKVHDSNKYGVEMAGDVLRLMDHLNLEKAHVVGYSLGGFITEYLLVTHPDRFLTATIGGMGWIKADDERMAFMSQLADAIESGKGIAELAERLRPANSPKPTEAETEESLKVFLSNDVRSLAACARRIPTLCVTEEQLQANQVPTLAIVGEIDPLKVTVDALEKVMPNLTVEVIAGADHGSALASPKLAEQIDAFLEAHATAAAAN